MSAQTTDVTSAGVATDPFDSWVMPSTSWFGPSPNNVSAQVPTSNAGVPQTAATTSSTQQAVAFGAAATARPVYQQPVFWAIVLMVVAVIMLSHVARLQIK